MVSQESILRRLVLAGALLIFASGGLCAQSKQQPAAERPEEPPNGTITGRIVNESGQPVSNSMVYSRVIGTINSTRTTLSDADGNFQFTGLDSALYSIFATSPGYVTSLRDFTDSQASLYRVGDAVKLTLVKGAVLTGTVVNSASEPVIAVQVHALMIRDAEGKQPRSVPTDLGWKTTDDRGIYRIYGLQPGTYVVFAGAGTSFGFNVTAYDTDVPTYAPSSTRDTASEITLRAGDEITGVDIRYRGEQGHTVSGSVTGAVTPDGMNTYTVGLASIVNGKSLWSTSTIQPPNAKGFAINGLADGDYDIWSNSFVGLGDAGISEPKRIKVKGANVTGVELITKPLASVSGRLILESSKVEACKDKRRPVFTETMVYTQRDEKPAGPAVDRFLNSQAVPAKDGAIQFKNLAPGQYIFPVRFFAKYWYLDSVSLDAPAGNAKSGVTDAARNWTVLKLGDRLTGLNVKLVEGAASLRGQVKTENGQAVPDGLVFYLVPADREKANDVLRYYGTKVNSDGSFTLNNLAPGRYWAITKVPGENESLTKLNRPDQNETRLRLRRDAELAKKEVEFKLCENKTAFEIK